MITPIIYEEGLVKLLDQRKLPLEEAYIECQDHHQIAQAIIDMVVRGAPAIGITAALGVYLGVNTFKANDFNDFFNRLQKIIELLADTRPTAVNLVWALKRLEKVAIQNRDSGLNNLKQLLLQEALKIKQEEQSANEAIGRWGKALINDEDQVLTYCNTGSLATGGIGTALGIIKVAFWEGKKIMVWVSETRPFLQGARLTTWELKQCQIPHRLITDNAVGHLMQKGKINMVIVGADRVAANGDVANKIGTYILAVLAKEHKIPFYVAAPTSTIDLSLHSGGQIPIEERPPQEINHLMDKRISPEGTKVTNPAFDITPYQYIQAIITEKGIVRPPFSLNQL
jgi:methylthioribose-1-phosphate isomerase